MEIFSLTISSLEYIGDLPALTIEFADVGVSFFTPYVNEVNPELYTLLLNKLL